MEDNNKIKNLEERFEEKDLSSLSNEELLYELRRTHKLYNGLVSRAASLMGKIFLGHYNSNNLLQDISSMLKVHSSISLYMSHVADEIGERMGLSKRQIIDVASRASKETDY